MPTDPTLFLYTSLTAGSSHIITATSRIETILKANKIPFKAVDCATDDKARMLWQRRSKGRKIPGLVKFGDVIADLDQVEEWNEYGELEDQIEDQVDIFGDVPISATSAEAQAAAAARVEAQRASLASQGRTASETRHISISDPKEGRKKSEDGSGGKDTQKEGNSPLSMAMRQAGAEAAAKTGQKKGAVGDVKAQEAAKSKQATDSSIPAPVAGQVSKLDADAEDVSKVETGAKTPGQLASQGQSRTSVDKLGGIPEDEDSKKSNSEQILDQRRQSSIPQTGSSLAQTTSIDESHTVTSSDDVDIDTKADKSMPPSSKAVSADKKAINEHEKAIAEDDGEDDDEEEEEAGPGDDNDEPVKKAAKVSATDTGEEKVLQGSKPQEQEAADSEEAGKSVGD
ncbi:hypothetical protein PMZ80_003858 [Knufia obscura]|uniref:Uncharacterized protein n=1 Tax=Knufia obscura TaxID=1635080 RepID=A0ABR0RVF7_9EURO|nr:hypothetical protein PMZ80_003858 [Knufia obscura]